MSAELRQASTDDVQFLSNLFCLNADQEVFQQTSELEDHFQNAIDGRIDWNGRKGEARLFIALYQGERAGFVLPLRYDIRPHDDIQNELFLLAVDWKLHRLGIGRALVEKAVAWLGNTTRTAALCDVTNKPILDLLMGCGFQNGIQRAGKRILTYPD